MKFKILYRAFKATTLLKIIMSCIFTLFLVNGEIQCKFCDQREVVRKREESLQRLTVHKKISDHKIGLFDAPSNEINRFVHFLFFIIIIVADLSSSNTLSDKSNYIF